ncbi:MAG: signal transduction histidine kinase [Cyclobacteriaceae bacterium]|jgi:signal transduction histidine kinase
MNEKIKPRLLMVDDLPENLFSLDLILKDLDYELDKALSGEEALKMARKNDYSLFLMDVQMPGMDGFEVAELLKGNKKTKSIPIIFLSAINKDEQSIRKGFAKGAIDYISKPIDEFLLKLKIKTMLQFYVQQNELEEAREELKQINHELENLVEKRTKNLAESNFNLQQEIIARKLAERNLIKAQEVERRRIGHEIHDGLGQMLVATKFSIDLLEGLSKEEMNEQIEEIETIIGDTIEESRRLIKNLSTRVLEELGFDKAIEELCNRTALIKPLKITRDTDINDEHVDRSVLAAVYRIIQEGLNNVVKYSEAKHLKIEVKERNDELEILILDDGKGFDMNNPDFTPGNGLSNMNVRAVAFNGNLRIESSLNNGTKIHGFIPVNNKKENHE